MMMVHVSVPVRVGWCPWGVTDGDVSIWLVLHLSMCIFAIVARLQWRIPRLWVGNCQ